MNRQFKISILALVVLIIATGLIYWSRGSRIQPADNQKAGGASQALEPIAQSEHILGEVSAPVTMIIYSDFECPFCAQFAAAVKQVEQEFKDKIAISFRHFPLAGHAQALVAAQASECASEQGKFWEMHDKLFAANAANSLGEEQFYQDAADLGLNQEQFRQCLADNKYADKIRQQAAAGKKAGVTGTPTSFINGNIYPGAYPVEDFTSSDGQPEKGLRSIISDLLK